MSDVTKEAACQVPAPLALEAGGKWSTWRLFGADPAPGRSLPGGSRQLLALRKLEQAGLSQQALGPVVDFLQGTRGADHGSSRRRLCGTRTSQLQQVAATREGEECEADSLTDQPGVVRGQDCVVGVAALLAGTRASERAGRHPVEAELGPA